MLVLTADQRASRSNDDLVGEWSARLNDRFSSGLRLPFARTAGDEMQALFTDPEALFEVVLACLDDGSWWLGIGLGDPHPLGDTARDSQGSAFRNARIAVEEAKKQPWGCVAVGEPAWSAVAFNGCIAMLERLRRDRTPRASEIVALALSGAKQAEIAARLRITRQAVSKQLKNAGYEEEQLGRRATVEVLRQAG